MEASVETARILLPHWLPIYFLLLKAGKNLQCVKETQEKNQSMKEKRGNKAEGDTFIE